MREIIRNYNIDHLPENYNISDLHIHTNMEGDGSLTPFEVVDVAAALGLNAVAVTEHDSLKPAEVAREYAEKKSSSVEIVVGTEVTTSEGHLLGLFVRSPVQKNLSL